MAGYLLFGTAGCHLCEEAEELLTEAGIEFSNIDIIDDEASQQQYGTLIPVLLDQASGRQLNWPFDSEQLRNFTVAQGNAD